MGKTGRVAWLSVSSGRALARYQRTEGCRGFGGEVQKGSVLGSSGEVEFAECAVASSAANEAAVQEHCVCSPAPFQDDSRHVVEKPGLNGCDLENGGQEFVGEILVIRLVIGDGENGSGSEDRDTRTEGDGVEQKEERQGVRAEVERLEERRRAATGSHPWFARDEANKDDVTAEEQEQSAFGTGPWPRQSEIMGELLATGDEDEFADAAKGSNVASPRRGTAAVTTEMKDRA
ncbi:hypothetical protein PC121_g12076 [Phytophthora cactorum]|nr:hypothetical protein PC121_g12076 [Phytophthora cactorum]